MGAKRKDDDINGMFEKQQHHLNRRRILQGIGGLLLLAAAYLALQLTPYRDLPQEAVTSAVGFAKDFFSSGSSEPDAKYW